VNDACSVGIDSGLYGALATVAAITTALLSLVALLVLQRGTELKRITEDDGVDSAGYNRAKRVAWPNFWGHGVLNLVALIVNAAVVAAWWKIGVTPASDDQWQYWLPCYAVITATVVLIGPAAVGLCQMRVVATL
jgi:hypothetical protein